MPTAVLNGIDYSSGWPSGREIADAGYAFAARYMGEDARCLTAREKASLDAAGVAIVAIGEFDTILPDGSQRSAMVDGAQAGAKQAAYANSRKLGLGLPAQQPIFFTLDVEPGSVPWSAVRAYMQAAAGMLGGPDMVGIYAGFDGVEFCRAQGLCDWYWQTYAWSGGRVHEAAHIYQYDIYGEYVAGINVDLNVAFSYEYGQNEMFVDRPVQPKWASPQHPDWLPSHLADRYPSVKRWEWHGQTLRMDVIRHNMLALRRSWQYAQPTTASGHAGRQVLEGDKIPVECLTTVTDPKGGTRDWVLTGWGTWVPADVGDTVFEITKRQRGKQAK